MFHDFANLKIPNGNIAIGVVCIDGVILDLETWGTLGYLAAHKHVKIQVGSVKEAGPRSLHLAAMKSLTEEKSVVEVWNSSTYRIVRSGSNNCNSTVIDTQGLLRIDKEQEAQTLDYLKEQKS
jgi:20S proteasome alpha/beta subunit